MKRVLFCLAMLLTVLRARAADDWQSALATMPLDMPERVIDRTNVLHVLLPAFQSNNIVKAFILMPGATDEFFFFRRALIRLTNAAPTLLDAVNAITNQTAIKVTFHPPLLLLHTDEDPLDVLSVIKDQKTADKIQRAPFESHAVYVDRDWDSLLPILKKAYHVQFLPERHSKHSWHFYRHSLAAWNLTGFEALQAIAYAGKTKYVVERKKVVFDGDDRIRIRPKFDHFPE